MQLSELIMFIHKQPLNITGIEKMYKTVKQIHKKLLTESKKWLESVFLTDL